jgi:hypothetical protein
MSGNCRRSGSLRQAVTLPGHLITIWSLFQTFWQMLLLSISFSFGCDAACPRAAAGGVSVAVRVGRTSGGAPVQSAITSGRRASKQWRHLHARRHWSAAKVHDLRRKLGSCTKLTSTEKNCEQGCVLRTIKKNGRRREGRRRGFERSLQPSGTGVTGQQNARLMSRRDAMTHRRQP